jgi:CelD/BcsL family acetyltransferase involved in cellulose biosynthesis
MPIATEIRDSFDGLHEGWEALYAAASQSFCQSPVYCRLAGERALRRGARLRIVCAFVRGELVGLWPLAAEARGALKPLGCGSGEEYQAPLAAPGDAGAILTALLTAAFSIKADSLHFFHVESGSALDKALMSASFVGRPHRIGSLPALRAGLSRYDNWEAFAATRSTSHWANLRRKRRKLEAAGAAEFGWARGPEEADALIGWIAARKRKWAEANAVFTDWVREEDIWDYFKALARRIDLADYPLVSYVKLDGRPICGQINLVGSSVFEYFITAYDEDYGHLSPGELGIDHTMRWAFERKLDYDFRILFYAYKERWSDRQADMISREFLLTRRGEATARATRLFDMARGKLRRALWRGRRWAGGATASAPSSR